MRRGTLLTQVLLVNLLLIAAAVIATAECSGLRPVANAFGCACGITYRAGIGIFAVVVSSRTIA
jgi:hypothetical protein